MSQDWSDVNYSSPRRAAGAWKTPDRRRFDYAIGFAGPARARLEECHEVDKLPMPNGVVPDFPEARAAFGRAMWLAPASAGWTRSRRRRARSWARAPASNLELEAAQQGLDWEENLDQLAREKEAFESRGLRRRPLAGADDEAATTAAPAGQGRRPISRRRATNEPAPLPAAGLASSACRWPCTH